MKRDLRATYVESISTLESQLRQVLSTHPLDKAHLATVQSKLDQLAEKYQYADSVGKARYKLYDLQAHIHYLNEDYNLAKDFINQAVETRTESYVRAENLLSKLKEGKDSAVAEKKGEKEKSLNGVEGWLVLFLLGVVLSGIKIIITLVQNSSAVKELNTYRTSASEFVAAAQPLLYFEVLVNVALLGLSVWLFVLIARRRKAGKLISIIYLSLTPLLLIVDYTWAFSLFDSFNVSSAVENEMKDSGVDMTRAVLTALVWIPYFLVSKRVKNTLIQ